MEGDRMITFLDAEPEIAQWLRENGVDPTTVPRACRPDVRPDGSVRLPIYLLNEAGYKYVGPDGEPAMSEVVIRATAPPLAVVQWLNGELAP
jgi:hypothetical protein